MPSSGTDTMLGLAMRFSVTIDHGMYNLGSWQKVEGLDVQWEIVEYRAGDQKNQRWYFPGFTKYSNIKLSRAASKDDTEKVKKWLNSNSFKMEKQSGSVKLLDAKGEEVASWDLENVIPVHWSVSGFDATASKLAIETLELAHAGFLDE
jgi:phage tail-like protein